MKKENKELINLLYRKKVSEDSMTKYSKGVEVHSKLSEEIRKKLEDKSIDPLERSRLEIELNKNDWETRIFTTNYKLTRREYQHGLIPRIHKIANNKEQESIQFINHYKKAEELAKIEIFGKTEKQPENIEHVIVIKDIENLISVLEKIISELPSKIESEKDGYVKAKMEKELFDSELHLKTLRKRLNSRLDYYNNQFLPIYTIELAEAKEKIEIVHKRACEIVACGIDIQLKMVIDMYEQHKNDEERLWLFYTTLRNRVNSIMDEIKKNPKQYKEFKHLSNPI